MFIKITPRVFPPNISFYRSIKNAFLKKKCFSIFQLLFSLNTLFYKKSLHFFFSENVLFYKDFTYNNNNSDKKNFNNETLQKN